MRRRFAHGIAATAILLVSASSGAQPVKVDPAIPAYRRPAGSPGT